MNFYNPVTNYFIFNFTLLAITVKLCSKNAPLQLQLNSPLQLQLNSPLHLQVNSPLQLQLNSPLQLQLNSPLQLHLNSPLQLQLNSPLQLQLNSPLQLHLNSPLQLHLNSPYNYIWIPLYNYNWTCLEWPPCGLKIWSLATLPRNFFHQVRLVYFTGHTKTLLGWRKNALKSKFRLKWTAQEWLCMSQHRLKVFVT